MKKGRGSGDKQDRRAAVIQHSTDKASASFEAFKRIFHRRERRGNHATSVSLYVLPIVLSRDYK